MKLYFESLKSNKYKTKINKINAYIIKNIKKTKLECDNIYIYWSKKQFQKITRKKRFLPDIKGGKVCAIVDQPNDEKIEIYLNSSKLDDFSLDFFKFAFLHEIAHLVLQNRKQIFVENIKPISLYMKNFIQKNKELKNAVYFLNYCIDDVSVDMNFIKKYSWSKPLFLKSSKYMLRRYVSRDMYKQNTQTRINCLIYIMSASRFFIPTGFLIKLKIKEYDKLLSYFKEQRDSKAILDFNKQIADFIHNLYHGSDSKKLLNLYSKLLNSLRLLYCNCLTDYPCELV